MCSTPSSSRYLCSTPSSLRDGGVECVFAFPAGGAPLGASMLRLNAAVVSNAAPTGTVARIPRRRPYVTQVYSKTRLYAIDYYTVHVINGYGAGVECSRVSCKNFITGAPYRETKGKAGPQPSPPGPKFLSPNFLESFCNNQHLFRILDELRPCVCSLRRSLCSLLVVCSLYSPCLLHALHGLLVCSLCSRCGVPCVPC